MKDYYIGLDIGTDSIGWAAADTDYRIMKFRGNAMWGTRLFDESNTAEERRSFRTARRRVMRKRDRLNTLESLFDEEITKKDPSFFQKLKESNLYFEDKSTECPYTLFNDPDYKDADYHRQYPTVYHLRKDLIENASEHDVRLVFLALHHIIKNRGHFLFDSLGENAISSFKTIFIEFCSFLNDEYSIDLQCDDPDGLSEILKDQSLGKAKKKAAILKFCDVSKKADPQLCAILSALSGSSVKLCDIFNDEELKTVEIKSIDFSGKFEDAQAELESILGERFELVAKMKAIYDWAVLADILSGEKYISFAKVKTYEKHKSDLKLLKKFVKRFCPDEYNNIFRISDVKLCNYVAYSGCVKQGGKTGVLEGTCTQTDFCAFLKKVLPSVDDPEYTEMFQEIENASFTPKQVTSDNGVIPMQVHRAELLKILENAQGYLPFLSEKDENGLTVSEKIVSIFDFRIPYYVGPLNTHSDKAWLVRKAGKITPWNFSQMVDIDLSAEKFISNLTSKCTYLPDKDVIPKFSLLYSSFTVLNELNNLRINGEKIAVEDKQNIYNTLFRARKKVTQKAIKDYFKALGYTDIDITGIDGDFKSTLRPYIELSDYELTNEEKEEAIKAITVFGDDKKLLRKRLSDRFGGKLSQSDILKISKLKYSGWGRLSKEFLTDIYSVDPETGEYFNIINALWSTNDNLMVLLGSKYTFAQEVEKARQVGCVGSIKEMVEELYVSPKVKRPIYQSVKIVQEIVKATGCAPKKIFVEMARGSQEKKRTVSRKSKLLDLYKTCKKEAEELYEQLESTPDDAFKRDKLYLYYTQFGKDMYTGESIPIENLFNKDIYDIDHIFPRSKVKDDSLDNRVLVKKTDNAEKKADYPLSSAIHAKMYGFWKFLKDKELISKTKFERLIRNTPLTDEELADFISRQLVETRQSTKAVAQILGSLYDKDHTEIVYVKAGTVSDFRQYYDMLKCREVNDLHHAKDAYLNIVVGNVYNERYTHNKINFIKGLQVSAYSLNAMFNYDVKNAWTAKDDLSLNIVKKQMNKNNILYTRYSYVQAGGLFDQMPLKKGNGQVPLKQNSPRSDISKYGGYNRPSAAFFAFAEYDDAKKDKRIKALIAIDSYRLKEYNADPEKYLREICGLKNPKILLKQIKYNACLSFNGCRMHISSKSGGGATIVYKPAVQLVLGYDLEKYIKTISKFVSGGWDRDYTKYDGLSPEKNTELFDALCHKMTDTVMAFNLGSIGAKTAAKKEIFKSLSVQEQCYVLLEILKIMHANVLAGDLTFIGEAKKAGVSTTNNKLSEIKGIRSVKLINQSVTGLYESETALI